MEVAASNVADGSSILLAHMIDICKDIEDDFHQAEADTPVVTVIGAST